MNKFLLSTIFVLIFCGFVFSQNTPKTDKEIEETDSVQQNTPLKILEKPKPRYPTSENGTICIQGTVVLRVQFLASGEIGKVTTITNLPYGATENAIEAAKNIKFKPAFKNGEPISVTKIITFNFTIY
ncbi:MAG TPA: energy transducer TonB [Pyrinomonadaceae bacterium]|nr:energy transducer TonB [Pyrinomonadaceae bacterium]